MYISIHSLCNAQNAAQKAVHRGKFGLLDMIKKGKHLSIQGSKVKTA